MNQKRETAYWKNKFRKERHRADIAETRLSAVEFRASVSGMTILEQRKLWKLAKTASPKLQDHLMYVLSPAVWMTKTELKHLTGGE